MTLSDEADKLAREIAMDLDRKLLLSGSARCGAGTFIASRIRPLVERAACAGELAKELERHATYRLTDEDRNDAMELVNRYAALAARDGGTK